jgi:hypothetical protein
LALLSSPDDPAAACDCGGASSPSPSSSRDRRDLPVLGAVFFADRPLRTGIVRLRPLQRSQASSNRANQTAKKQLLIETQQLAIACIQGNYAETSQCRRL